MKNKEETTTSLLVPVVIKQVHVSSHEECNVLFDYLLYSTEYNKITVTVTFTIP